MSGFNRICTSGWWYSDWSLRQLIGVNSNNVSYTGEIFFNPILASQIQCRYRADSSVYKIWWKIWILIVNKKPANYYTVYLKYISRKH